MRFFPATTIDPIAQRQRQQICLWRFISRGSLYRSGARSGVFARIPVSA